MGYLFVILLLFISSFCFFFILKKEASWIESFCISVFTSMFILVIFGVIDKLLLGVYCYIFLCIIGGILVAWKYRKEITESDFRNSQLLFLFIICAIIYIIQIGRGLGGFFDHYSHWALTVKNMFCTNQLSVHPWSVTEYKEYPPAVAVFQYLINVLGNAYSEENCFRGMNIIIVSIMLAIISPFIGTDRKNNTLVIVSAILFPTIFNYAYTELIVDCLLGLLFAYILINYYRYVGIYGKNVMRSRIYLLNIALGTFVIVMTKSSGVGLVALGVIIAVFDMIAVRKFNVAFWTMSISAATTKTIWSLTMKYNLAEKKWDTESITVGRIFEVVKTMSDETKAILSKYISDYVYPNTSLNFISLSYITWIAIILFIIYRIPDSENFTKKRKRLLSVSALLAIGGYSLYLLLLYFFVWGKALTDGSFYRYLNSVYMGMLLLVIVIFIDNKIEKDENYVKKNVIIGLIAVIALCRPYEIVKVCTGMLHGTYSDEYECVYDKMENVEKLKNTVVISVDEEPKKDVYTSYKYVPYKTIQVTSEKEAEIKKTELVSYGIKDVRIIYEK